MDFMQDGDLAISRLYKEIERIKKRLEELLAAASVSVGSTVAPHEAVLLTGDQSVDGVKTFLQQISGDIDGNAGTVTNGVYLVGNQTINGIKTFVLFPVTPSSAPSSNYQVANKKYVDDNAGAGNFLGLSDTPASYTGQGSKLVSVKSSVDGLEFVDAPVSVGDFIDLGDVPSSYSGQGDKILAVKTSEDGIKFIDAPEGGGGGSSDVDVLDDLTDVYAPAVLSQDRNILIYNGTSERWEIGDLPTIEEIENVEQGASPTVGDVLVYREDGGIGVWKFEAATSQDLVSLGDVEIAFAQEDDVLAYDAGDTKWKNKTLDLPENLDDLSNVEMVYYPDGGDVLTFNNVSTQWENAPLPDKALDDLSDVNLGAPSDNDVLTYDSATSKWLSEAPSGGGGGGGDTDVLMVQVFT